MFAIKSCLPYEVLSTPPSVEVLSVSVGFSNPSNIALLGDFNSGDINWSSLSGNNRFSQKLCDVIFQLNLFQLIDKPSHSAGNILDLVLTDVPESISNLIIHSEPPHPIPSDHFVITFDYSSNNCTNNSALRKIFNFPKGNYNDLCNFLANHDFSSYYMSEDIELT